MKIPPVAIKRIKPYVKKSDYYNCGTYECKNVVLELELTNKWKKVFSTFGRFNIILNYTGLYMAGRSYTIDKIFISGHGDVPNGYGYYPDVASKNKFSTLFGRSLIIKKIKEIRFHNNKDIAMMKLLRRY